MRRNLDGVRGRRLAAPSYSIEKIKIYIIRPDTHKERFDVI